MRSMASALADLFKVTNGRISDNWHIEDNLTLLKLLRAITQ